MTSDQALLTQIAEELPYLNYFDGEVMSVLKFGSGRGSQVIYIRDGILYLSLYLSTAKIDLFTCEDPVKEIHEYIKRHNI